MKSLVLIGLVGAGVALLLKEAHASSPAEQIFDPGLGLPRVQTKRRMAVASLSQPVDVYEWGPSATPKARLLVASDDTSSYVAFVPPTVGDVKIILGQGNGPMTAELLAFVRKANA